MRKERRSPRSRHDSVLELDVPGTLRLVDVSDHGLAFTTTADLDTGRQVRGTVRTLKRGARTFTGKIVWRKRKGNALAYGLEFDGQVPLPALDERLGGSE